MKRSATICCMLSITFTVTANPLTQDKAQYSIFNPTPRELWRPLSADRPDFTESPYTVDAGAIQIESSFISYSKQSNAESWNAAATNIKVGLLNNTDLQFVITPYTSVTDGLTTDEGFGDTQIRLKINLWGNDAGETAFAFMPFLTLPTASDSLSTDHIEGGIIFPFSTPLTEELGLGLMFETDFVFDPADDSYDSEFIGTAVIGFDATETLGLYIEAIGSRSTDGDAEFQGILGLGATYTLDQSTVLDAGINLGLTNETDDINVFAGLTIRF